MAPFPETEIMTIKRLEVALRKMDFKLLKDGAYKLHEKYHGGFKFEYLDLLKDLFVNISNNQAIPMEIKDILAPTIEDILAQQGIKTDTTSSPYDSLQQDRVSSLTSLSYKTRKEDNNDNSSKIDAFSAFSSKKGNNSPTLLQKIGIQVPAIGSSSKEFEMISKNEKNNSNNEITQEKVVIQNLNTQQNTQQDQDQGYIQTQTQTPPIASAVASTITSTPQGAVDVSSLNSQQQNSEITIAQTEQIKNDVKTVTLFFSQKSSNEKIKNILKYRELISSLNSENVSLSQILNLISEINTQSNTNVSELKSIIEFLNQKGNKINLITNSQSANIIELLNNCKISFGMFSKMLSTYNTNLIPLFGLTNLFKCSHCAQEYVNQNNQIQPLLLTCPMCKSPMFPDFYAAQGQNCELNMEYYNSSLVALANSKVWLLVHPSFDEKIIFDLFKSALKVGNQVEEIFILDKDINIRQNYKKAFLELKKDIKINIQITALEDFLKLFK